MSLARYLRSCPPWHRINVDHPGLEMLHECPFIFRVRAFFTPAECAALRAKAASRLRPQTYDDEGIDSARTSMGCVARHEEVSGLRARLASLVNVSDTQLQPLKISRYLRGDRFGIHTDAWRGDRGESAADPEDLFADRARGDFGVPGAPIAGANRIATVFVYLNSCARGGRTRWRWINYDARLGGEAGERFYESPRPGHGRTSVTEGSGHTELAVRPEEGMAVVHFPSTVAERGGITDYNAYHESEAAEDEKWVAQQFIWSHARLDWRRVLDAENLEPEQRLSDSSL